LGQKTPAPWYALTVPIPIDGTAEMTRTLRSKRVPIVMILSFMLNVSFLLGRLAVIT
jgi:hypothetical protein